MNFIEEENLKKLWKKSNRVRDVDPLNIVKELFEEFTRILDINNISKGKTASVNDICWVFKQLYEKGTISLKCEANEWYIEADSITDVFINNTKVIWFPENIHNPNFGK